MKKDLLLPCQVPPSLNFLVKYSVRDIWAQLHHCVTFCENVTPDRALSVAASEHTKH